MASGGRSCRVMRGPASSPPARTSPYGEAPAGRHFSDTRRFFFARKRNRLDAPDHRSLDSPHPVAGYLSRMSPTIRELRTHDEYLACLELQETTWGDGGPFREAVGPAMLLVPQKIGGITAGAFAEDGRLVGFVYGLTGWRDGRTVHWSHMLAVAPDCRDRDVGRQLKEYQRAQLREAGVERMYWTYDPLVARNAHINFMKLGVNVSEYVPDIYGSNESSTVDAVIGTDRFIVEWDLASPSVRPRPDPHPAPESAPLVNASVEADGPQPEDRPLELAPTVHVAIPGDIQAVKTHTPDLARIWRHNTRRAFQHYLSHGYRVRDFIGTSDTPVHFYRLEHPEPR